MRLDTAKLRYTGITDRRQCKGDLAVAVERALEGGLTAIQLREKDLPGRALFDLAMRLREMTRAHDALLIVNDRVDVALAVEADGAQLGWTSLGVAPARRAVGARLALGASIHNLAELRQAMDDEPDYVVFGPVFETPSKRGLVPIAGLEALRSIVVESPVPVVAVGGIDRGNVGSVFGAGAAGAAAIRAVFGTDDPLGAAREFVAAGELAWKDG